MTPHDSTHIHFEGRKHQKVAHILVIIRSFGVLLLLAVLPFHAFIATVAKPTSGDFSIFTLLLAWKEVLAIGLLGVMILEIALKMVSFVGEKGTLRGFFKGRKLDFLDGALIFYTVIAIFFAVTQNTSLTQWAFGIRIDLLPFLFVLLGRHVCWPNKEKIISTVLAVGLITAVFGVLQSTVLPHDWLSSIGYSQNTYIEVAGAGLISTGTTTDALSSCPLLENSSSFCRAISTFGGPTRFGVYMLVIIGLIVGLKKGARSEKHYLAWRVGLSLCVLAAILTFSRSVWIGLLTMICTWSLIKWGRKALAVGIISLVAIGAIGIFALSIKDTPMHQNPLKSILTRSGSSSKHLEYAINGWNALKQNPLGLGVGTVGPAADRYTPFLTENWFLQIFVEMGVVGGVLFIGFTGALMWALYKAKTPLSQGVLLGLIGVSVAGLFTHSFEELAASYTLMILASLTLIRPSDALTK